MLFDPDSGRSMSICSVFAFLRDGNFSKFLKSWFIVEIVAKEQLLRGHTKEGII